MCLPSSSLWQDISCILISVSAEHLHCESLLFSITVDPAQHEKIFRHIVLRHHPSLTPTLINHTLCLPLMIFLCMSFFLYVFVGTFLQWRASLYLPFILYFHRDSWIPISWNVFLDSECAQVLPLRPTSSQLLYLFDTASWFFLALFCFWNKMFQIQLDLFLPQL